MICENCQKRRSVQRHHKFPQYRKHREHYGKLIDAPFNILPACAECNTSHAFIKKEHIWDEAKFRVKAEQEGYELPPPMKTLKGKITFRRIQ